MAYINFVDPNDIPEKNRVNDSDHIQRIHGVHSEIMGHHYALYKELMFGKGPLSRIQREMIAVTVSAINECHY